MIIKQSLGLFSLLLCTLQAYSAEPDRVFPLWAGQAPGIMRAKGPTIKLQNRPRPFYQLTQIAEPSLEIFIPKKTIANGTAILICPGGGMQRLAYEHEGLEVANWLNDQGIVAGVLKYRVPGPAKSAAMDAQRAISLLRQNATSLNIDSKAIGFLGFSAGGEIGAWLATRQNIRLYEAEDSTDQFRCRPDFLGLIYSGGLLNFRTQQLKTEFADSLSPDMPIIFMAHAFNDGCQNSLTLALALKKVNVPTELHLFQEGGHGFGARATGVPVDAWKARFMEWLSSNGFTDSLGIRTYTTALSEAIKNKTLLPTLKTHLSSPNLEAAYGAQTRWVKSHYYPDNVGGFKGAGASAGAQQSLGIDGPLVGVLPVDGLIEASPNLKFNLNETGPMAIETEIGYRIAVDISYEILSDQQAQEAVSAVVPIIELPAQRSFADQGSPAVNMAASNIGSFLYIVGEDLDPTDVDTDQWSLEITHNGMSLHDVKGSVANGGQFHNLRKIMNQLTQNGHTLPAGTLIISGALGGVHPAEPGHYRAQFGKDQVIEFDIQK